MKISYVKKTLSRKDSLEKHDGLIIRFQFDQHNIGYASYFPWIHLGQKSIDCVLDSIIHNRYDPTCESLLYRCWFDCFVAQKSIGSIENLPSFLNHSFLGMGEKFTHNKHVIKIKISGDIENDLKTIHKHLENFERLRLDANFKYSKSRFLEELKGYRERIEYIEDPYAEYLEYINQNDGFNIAVDQPYNNFKGDFEQFKIVSKPNLRFVPQDISQNSNSMIFSSNMGDTHAQWLDYHTLIRWGNLKVEHGLVTPQIFEMSDGIESLFETSSVGSFKPVSTAIEKAYSYYKGLKWIDI